MTAYEKLLMTYMTPLEKKQYITMKKLNAELKKELAL